MFYEIPAAPGNEERFYHPEPGRAKGDKSAFFIAVW